MVRATVNVRCDQVVRSPVELDSSPEGSQGTHVVFGAISFNRH